MHGAHHHFSKRWWVRFDSAQLRVNGGREPGIKVATCFILILGCCFRAVVGLFVDFLIVAIDASDYPNHARPDRSTEPRMATAATPLGLGDCAGTRHQHQNLRR